MLSTRLTRHRQRLFTGRQSKPRAAPGLPSKRVLKWLRLSQDSHNSSPACPPWSAVLPCNGSHETGGGAVPTNDPEQNEILVHRDGAVLTLTFNRPEARNAMTWSMYERLYQTAEEVDADDSVRVIVLRGAGGKAFVAGTDISQIESFAVGGGFAIAAVCDIRIATPESRFGFPIARTLGNCLSTENYSRCVELFGPSRVKEMIMRARLITAEEARAAAFVHEIVPAAEIAVRVKAIAEEVSSHAPITLRVTKEAVRRIQERRRLEGGEDLISL